MISEVPQGKYGHQDNSAIYQQSVEDLQMSSMDRIVFKSPFLLSEALFFHPVTSFPTLCTVKLISES